MHASSWLILEKSFQVLLEVTIYIDRKFKWNQFINMCMIDE